MKTFIALVTSIGLTIAPLVASPVQARVQTFMIIADNGTCLAAETNTMFNNGGTVQQQPCRSWKNLEWHWEGTSLVNSSGKCLDADTNTVDSDSTIVQLWDCNGWDNQQWHYNNGRLENGVGKCLDESRPDFDAHVDGGYIQAWSCHGEANQRWTMRNWFMCR